MNTNKKGFTLIELLVVIVIIGILATISVATFGGYFKKARDSERQSAVQNIATIMKVINATEETIDYSQSGANAAARRATLDTDLATQGYATPDSKNSHLYYYAFNTAADEFVVAACSEETDGKAFSAGTPNGIASITATCTTGTPTLASSLDTTFSW